MATRWSDVGSLPTAPGEFPHPAGLPPCLSVLLGACNRNRIRLKKGRATKEARRPRTFRSVAGSYPLANWCDVIPPAFARKGCQQWRQNLARSWKFPRQNRAVRVPTSLGQGCWQCSPARIRHRWHYLNFSLFDLLHPEIAIHLPAGIAGQHIEHRVRKTTDVQHIGPGNRLHRAIGLHIQTGQARLGIPGT